MDTKPGATLTFSYIATGTVVDDSLLRIQEDLGNALVRYPEGFETLDLAESVPDGVQRLRCGENAPLGADEIAVLIDDPDLQTIV